VGSGLYGARVGRRMVSRDKTHYANHEQLACSVMLPRKQTNSAQRLTTIWKRQAGARSAKIEATTLGVGKRALTGVHKNAKTLQPSPKLLESPRSEIAIVSSSSESRTAEI